MSDNPVADACDRVHDEATFCEFLLLLSREHRSGETEDWANLSIGMFLDGAAAWAEASKDGLLNRGPISNGAVTIDIPDYLVPDNPWKRCADIIHMGKVYE